MQTVQFPFVDLRPIHHSIRQDMKAAIDGVLDREIYICGNEVDQFEKEFARYCEAPFAIGISNGLDALVLALRALEIGPGDEVIVPANTFIATALAVSAVGAKPVLVDVDPRTFNIDPALTQKALTSKTKAVLAVHLYGQSADLTALEDLCRSAKIHLIEDAAQAHGARWKGRRIGSFGIAAGFSFYPGKNLGALGDGGATTSTSEKIADRVRLLRGYGSRQKYIHEEKGVNARLDELQAAVLRVKLRQMDRWTEERRQIAEAYDTGLRGLGLELPALPADRENHVWHLYVARSKNRAEVQRRLTECGVQTLIHYPIPIHLQKAYADLGHERGDFPVTEQLSSEIFSLPLWVGLDVQGCLRLIQQGLR